MTTTTTIPLTITCPDWCEADHDPREGTQGNSVLHAGEERTIPLPETWGGPLSLTRMRIEGTSDGSDFDGFDLGGEYSLTSEAMRTLAAELLSAADRLGKIDVARAEVSA